MLQDLRLRKNAELKSADGKIDAFIDGFNNAFIAVEEAINDFQEKEAQKTHENGERLWYKGSPENIKENNSDDYVVIVRAVFEDGDKIKYGGVYISTDYWDGTSWEHYFDPTEWDVLYFTKLKWLHFPIPAELNLKKRDEMFLK